MCLLSRSLLVTLGSRHLYQLFDLLRINTLFQRLTELCLIQSGFRSDGAQHIQFSDILFLFKISAVDQVGIDIFTSLFCGKKQSLKSQPGIRPGAERSDTLGIMFYYPIRPERAKALIIR